MVNSIAPPGFMPHGYCISWNTGLIAAPTVGNLLIAISCFTIPLVIMRFIRQRSDIDFRLLHRLFPAFIVTCGITHLLQVVEFGIRSATSRRQWIC